METALFFTSFGSLFQQLCRQEPRSTLLLLAYPAIAWTLFILHRDSGAWLLPVSLTGGLVETILGEAVWSVIILAGIAFFSLRKSRLANRCIILGILLLAIKYAVPLCFWPRVSRAFPRRRSPFWRTCFHTFSMCLCVLWLLGAYSETMRIRKELREERERMYEEIQWY